MEGTSQGGQGGFQFIKLDGLAKSIGASDAGLRFLIALLSGYPFAFIYHLFVSRRNPFIKNCYFVATGLLVLYFCFAQDFVYPIISVLVTYVVLTLIGGTTASVAVLFFFNLAYLVIAYFFCASDSYDIKWTTPQCILCLRLTGLAWDCYDGKRPKDKLTADQQLTALDRIPTLTEIAGYSFYFGGQMAGPQFPMRRYLDFIDGTLVDKEAEERAGGSRFLAALKRFSLGVLFLVLFVTCDPYYRSDYIVSRDFLDSPLWKKLINLVPWYHVMFCKYIFVWLFAEGSCTSTGLSFNGVDKNGIAKWDSLKNIKVKKFYTGYTFNSLVDCFNVNTNRWVARYVFKRLRFLGNKNISHITALAFLAIWHGFYVGYFICFSLEFIIIILERMSTATAYNLTGKTIEELNPVVRYPIILLLYSIKHIGFGYCVITFALLRWKKIMMVYSSMYHIGLLFYAFLYIANLLIIRATKQKKGDSEQERMEKKTS